MTSGTHPIRIARIDGAALVSNIALEVSDSMRLDISADAFGHGALDVARVAIEAGIDRFTVSTAQEQQFIATAFPNADVTVSSIDTHSVIAHYGLNAQTAGAVRPVMTLESTVIAVKPIEAGGGVSYGYTWKAETDGWLALIALGYGDGFNRAWGNRAMAWVGNEQFAAVGRVAMDAHSISTGQTQLKVGDRVTYFGTTAQQVVPASALAELVGCSSLAVTSSLGSRVVREFV